MTDRPFNFEEGEILLIDKPLRWTSFDIVKKVRNTIRIKKVGHAGTLDPLATGLLIVCTGKKTKQIDAVQAEEKEYTGTFTLGATTPSYDLETEPENQKDISGLTPEQIRAATVAFVGDIEQLPPMYSAVSVGGERLYQKARRGEEIERAPRPVTIMTFEVTDIALPVVSFRVVCSKGTYIRSLAHDFGQALGVGAYLSELRRTRSGAFRVEDAWQITDLIEVVKLQRAQEEQSDSN
ncbi:tRNA pseudouridine55 synthase [Flexibacter flexilis DSM 6793]|uniref:tRNA pseudouridine synthase B n=1 Tax=Flexibacter flexilis DSM 6793 TaxID=927664 RepID=A0A1I1MKB3_9BACT|nr:tRNA pseudouridine(55) synthase TruB [Flexibacter flexilis]SFC83073.1 tRNA pseudouridine55 synthase [Flexibacter flexilis DSM 6793]